MDSLAALLLARFAPDPYTFPAPTWSKTDHHPQEDVQRFVSHLESHVPPEWAMS